jgi:hypothetical protein
MTTTKPLPTLYLIPLSRNAPEGSATPLEWGYDLVDSLGNIHSTTWGVEGYHPNVQTDVKVEGYRVVQFIGPATHIANP